jgi:hypothetical protein
VQVDNFAAATDASLREETYRQPFLLFGGIIRGAVHVDENDRGNEGKRNKIKIRKKSPLDRTKRASERERERKRERERERTEIGKIENEKRGAIMHI